MARRKDKNPASRKEIREKEIFSRFAVMAKLPIELATVKNGIPPEPDILCVHRDDGPLAFELTEICDPNFAKFFNTVTKSGEYYMRTQDPTDTIIRNKLRKKYCTGRPIELLCHTDGRVGTPVEQIKGKIRWLMSALRGPFRRAWLMDGEGVFEVWCSQSQRNQA